MHNPRLFNPAVHFLIVNAGNAKDYFDPAILQHMRDLRAKGTCCGVSYFWHYALQN